MSNNEATADSIYHNGIILTMEDRQLIADAIAVKDGKILVVGNEDGVMGHHGSYTKMIDLAGATLMPGFVDSHSHMALSSIKLAAVQMDPPPAGNISSISDIQSALRDELARAPVEGNNWLVGWGYDHSSLTELRHPNKADLDQVSTEIPIYLYHYSAHQAVVNSKALEILGIDENTPDPDGGVIARKQDSREPTGLLEETAKVPAQLLAMRSLMKSNDPIQLIMNSIDVYAAKGFTTVSECSGRPDDMARLEELALANRLKLDVIAFPFFELTPPEEVAKKYSQEYTGHYRVGGMKLMLDGGSPGRTAYLRDPYHVQLEGESGYRGYARMAQEQTNDMVVRAYKNDIPLIIHTLGDAATDQCIVALNVGQYAVPKVDRRTQLIHLQQVQEDQFDRLKDLDVTLTFQVTHNYYFGDFHNEHIFGPIRTQRLNPIASALKRGISSTIHHDSPVHPIDQLFLVWTAVNRATRSGKIIGQEQRISVLDALKASTINAAYQWREEDHKGSLVAGKLADFVILNENPLDIDPMKIKDIKILETIKEGRSIYKAGSS